MAQLRLLRVGGPGRERPCLSGADGVVRDASAWLDDWAGSCLDPEFIAAIAGRFERDWQWLPEVDTRSERIGPPVRPGQIISIGLNYRRHALAVGMSVPTEPIVSCKSVHALAGPHDDLLIPPGSEKTDWEVELAVVIGRRAEYLAAQAQTAPYIAGYCTANDVSERHWLLERGGEWIKGKSFRTFAPLGPFLVPTSHFEPERARLTCRVNGRLMQDDDTGDMIFKVDELVRYLSRCLPLEPGDVVLTGSPAGMAIGRPDQPYLRDGDWVETEVAGLGAQRQRCRRYEC
jgi:2-keto-4-pentenoate hydratase/2-oxohepta-3-ene-1,7-dioic acid hydratase in catechol pathway